MWVVPLSVYLLTFVLAFRRGGGCPGWGKGLFYWAVPAGILLHLTSLPSARFDDDCLRWLDFMHEAGLSVWQMLPLVIPDAHGSRIALLDFRRPGLLSTPSHGNLRYL